MLNVDYKIATKVFMNRLKTTISTIIYNSDGIYKRKMYRNTQEQSDLGPHCLSMRLQIF